ncbi:MAG: glutamate-5-semialdehyde dehydrogenase [Armatimonadetes bacterium]|nr:glutamate-5-semialdehyde dehydrogenase [Armatimonadota bacterium]
MATQLDSSIEQMARSAQKAAARLAVTSSKEKDAALIAMADALVEHQDRIIDSNRKDLEAGRESGLSEALIDRLTLTGKRIADMAEGLNQLAALPDPIGRVNRGWRLPNGLDIKKVSVPLGVIGIIFESRPNVTVDAAGLCLKSGNAVILRGGKEAIHSNLVLADVIAQAAVRSGMPQDCIQLVPTTDRAAATAMMEAIGLIDCLIPRGGSGLIQSVVQNAKVPVIETGVGNCHTFVDSSADLQMAEDIAFNAKVQRCGVCNAMETLLVHSDIAEQFLPGMCHRLREAGVEIRGDETVRRICPDAVAATEEDWATEYLGLILAIRVVDSLDQAIEHINTYGSKHSDCIVTRDYNAAQRFEHEIDAAAVYVNASTRFTDGFQYGLGAEIGISTQKLHARGPMGLEELTTVKYVCYGNGQIRS